MSRVRLGATRARYLGYSLSLGGELQAGRTKTEAVNAWTPPASQREVKRLLQQCSFFKRTISGFATMTYPLMRVADTRSTWDGGPLPSRATEAFHRLKRNIALRPGMMATNPDLGFILTVRTSVYGLEVTLSQKDLNGVEQPCIHASRLLHETESHWAETIRELGALKWAMYHFRMYLIGKEFLVRMVPPRQTEFTPTQRAQMTRLWKSMEDFLPFRLEYLQTPLSGAKETIIFARPEDIKAGVLSKNQPEVPLEEWSPKSPNYKRVMIEGQPPNHHLIFYQNSSPVTQLRDMQKQDPLCRAIAIAIAAGRWPPNPSLKELTAALFQRAEISGGLVKIRTDGERRVLVPRSIRAPLMKLAHNHLLGHRDHRTTYHWLRAEGWYWPGQREDVEDYIQNCEYCHPTRANPSEGPDRVAGHQDGFDPIDEFNSVVFVDLLNFKAVSNFEYLLIMQDLSTGWLEMALLKDRQPPTVTNAVFDHWICRHGLMKAIITNQDWCLQAIDELGRKFQVRQIGPYAAGPELGNVLEALIKSAVAFVRRHLEGRNDWPSRVAPLQFAYNSTTPIEGGSTPFQLAIGRRPCITSQVVNGRTVERRGDVTSAKIAGMSQLVTEAYSEHRKRWRDELIGYNHRVDDHRFQPGDYVSIHPAGKKRVTGPLPFPYSAPGPWIVLEDYGNNRYYLTNGRGQYSTMHANRMKHLSYLEQRYELIDPDENIPPAISYNTKSMFDALAARPINELNSGKGLPGGNNEEDQFGYDVADGPVRSSTGNAAPIAHTNGQQLVGWYEQLTGVVPEGMGRGGAKRSAPSLPPLRKPVLSRPPITEGTPVDAEAGGPVPRNAPEPEEDRNPAEGIRQLKRSCRPIVVDPSTGAVSKTRGRELEPAWPVISTGCWV